MVAKLHPEKLVELKEAMDKVSECELELGGFCGEVHTQLDGKLLQICNNSHLSGSFARAFPTAVASRGL